MQRLSKAQRKAQSIALANKWKGSNATDSLSKVACNTIRKNGVIMQVKR